MPSATKRKTIERNWSAHYNWQFLRLNKKYAEDFDELLAMARKISRHADKRALDDGFIDLDSYDDGKKGFGDLEDAVIDFSRLWQISHPVSPTQSSLPRSVKFLTRNLFYKRVAKSDFTPHKISQLFYRAQILMEFGEKEEVLFLCLRKGSSLKSDLEKIVQEAQSLKSKKAKSNQIIRTDKPSLDRMIKVLSMSRSGLGDRRIATKMRVEFLGGVRDSDDFKGGVAFARKQAEKLCSLAPHLVFNPKA